MKHRFLPRKETVLFIYPLVILNLIKPAYTPVILLIPIILSCIFCFALAIRILVRKYRRFRTEMEVRNVWIKKP